MALTFSQKLRTTLGNKQFRIYEVTHDGSVTTIAASELDMNSVEYAIAQTKTAWSSVAGEWSFFSTASGRNIVFGAALSASAVSIVKAWGI